MSDRNLFQGKCLLSTEGFRHMPIFDRFPPLVRERLRNSPFNLCAACVVTAAGASHKGMLNRLLAAISSMEEAIRRES